MDNQMNKKKKNKQFNELELNIVFSEFSISLRFNCKYNIGNIFLFISEV